MEDVDGSAGVDDVGSVAGIRDVGREPDEMVGLDQHEKSKCASRVSTMPKRREDVDGWMDC